MKSYRNFDLELFDYRAADGSERFRVRVARSPAGEQRSAQAAERELDARLRTRVAELEARRLALAGMVALGRDLAALLLPPEARSLFDRSRAALAGDEGLRLRLCLDHQALADLPWELVHLPPAGGRVGGDEAAGFIVLDPSLSLARYEFLDAPPGEPAPAAAGPLRLVAVFADPAGLPPLDLAREARGLEAALAELPRLELETIGDGRFGALGSRLDAGAEIFHFAGHGRFAAEMGEEPGTVEGEGELLFVGEDGGARAVDAETLALNLRGHGVRLAVLGACEAARRDRVNPWTGIAPALVRHGIPAVVAMQMRFKDASAIAFSRRFYECLAAGKPVDAAVTAGRVAVVTEAGAAERDWAVPVLYLRSESGALFATPGKGTPADEPLGRRFWVNLGLTALGLLSLLGLYLFFGRPLLPENLRTVADALPAVVGAGLLGWLRWVAGDEMRAAIKRFLGRRRATALLAGALALAAAAGVWLVLRQPRVLRVVPGPSLVGSLPPADDAEPRRRFTLEVRVGEGEPAWRLDLRKSGAFLGARPWEMKRHAANASEELAAAARLYLEAQPHLSDETRARTAALWSSQPLHAAGGPRLAGGERLVLELRREGSPEPLACRVLELERSFNDSDRVEPYFLERGFDRDCAD